MSDARWKPVIEDAVGRLRGTRLPAKYAEHGGLSVTVTAYLPPLAAEPEEVSVAFGEGCVLEDGHEGKIEAWYSAPETDLRRLAICGPPAAMLRFAKEHGVKLDWSAGLDEARSRVEVDEREVAQRSRYLVKDRTDLAALEEFLRGIEEEVP